MNREQVQVTGSAMNGAEAADSRLVTRVRLRNYKSIAACDVRPAPLSFLVGPNGSGKSNFLDALRFVAEALRFSLEHALRERGGIPEVRRRGRPNHFGIRLDLQLPRAEGWYAFRVGAKARGGYGVQQEEYRSRRNTTLCRERDGRCVTPVVQRANGASTSAT